MITFPSGIAEGSSFCNRVDERAQLKKNITHIKHTVLMAPRRYGKTSLIRQVMLDEKYNHVWVDFLSVTNKKDIEDKIRKAATALLFKLAPELKKLQIQTKKLVKTLSPELNLNAMGQQLTLHLTTDEAMPIDEVLLELDHYAQKVKKKAVLVFDEFQQVSEIEKHKAVEALIRHAVERSHAITYVFSGSNRHLLADMFSQSSRPLYRLCQAMIIDRIDEKAYLTFLKKAAEKRWKHTVPDPILTFILQLTECHSFYVNVLCSELWSRERPPKTEKEIVDTWQWYINTHKSLIVADILSLPLNQKKLLIALAGGPITELYGADFSFKSRLSSSSVKRAMDALLTKDIAYVNKEGSYALLDPAIKFYLKNS